MKDRLRQELCAELKAIRKTRGLTQQRMADRLGITRESVANYESGRRDIPIDTFIKFCDICGIDAYEVLRKIQNYVYK